MQLAVVSLQLGRITNPGVAGGIKGEPGEGKASRVQGICFKKLRQALWGKN
jgi:hypothetical protein